MLRRHRRIVGVGLTAFSLLAAPATLVGRASVASSPNGAGCHADWHVVAHHAGGQVVQPQSQYTVCANETGYYTGETGIGVTKDGTIYIQAADWEWALARSQDDGATWTDYTVQGPQAWPGCEIGTSAFTPQCSDTESAKYNTVADGFVYVDPTTSRVFWSKTYGFAVCSSLNYSDDGKVWHPVTQFACPGGDYEKIAAGPPPKTCNAPCSQPTGSYPNIVYGCANGYTPWFVVGPGRFCWHSLDGGVTWTEGGAPVVPSPLAPGCLHFQEPQQVGPDGTLYVPLNCAPTGSNPAGLVKLAMSKDEGNTWSYVSVPTVDSGGTDVGNGATLIGGVSMAVDKGNNLYITWPGANNHVYLSVSTNQGATWNGPLDVGYPGISEGFVGSDCHAQVTADPNTPGHIAIAYYGFPNGGSSTTLDGYLSESFDATDLNPLFYSANVDQTNGHLYMPFSSGSLPRNDYLGVTFAPDGTPWTALVKLQPPSSGNPDSQGYVQSTGYAARLVASQPAADLPESPVAVALPGLGAITGLALVFGFPHRRRSRSS